MGFYSVLAEYYDRIFPFEESIGSFLQDRLPETRTGQTEVLDVACGTGTYSACLAQRDTRTTGLDADPVMIAEARRKFQIPNLEFITGDMLNLSTIFRENRFDMVYCIGNSLVHLKNEQEAGVFLEQCSGIMKTGGILIIQIINFDRIREQNITALPALNNKDIGFQRNYRFLDEEHVSFDTHITMKQEGRSFFRSIPLITLKKNVLEALLEHSGFKVTSIFGSYSKERWGKESFLTIAEAVIP